MTDTSELSALGVDALKDLLANLTQAKGFVLEQAPDFCRQIIAREYVNQASWSLWGLVLIAVSVVLIWRGRRMWKSADIEKSEGFLITAFILMLGAIPFAISGLWYFLYGLSEMLCLYVAPKVYLVQFISAMVHK